MAVMPRTPRARARPPRSVVAAAMPAPIPARTTLVSGSVIARNATATTSAINARRTGRRRATRASTVAAATSTPTLKPLIASTWLIPASRKDAAWGESPGSRTPVVIADTSARTPSSAHAGMPRRSARFADCLSDSSHRAGPAGVRSSTSEADGTSSTAVGSLARVPGLSGGERHDIQPRTRTSDPREGSRAMPATRTETRPSMGAERAGSPSASAVTMDRTASAKDCDASLRRNSESRSEPPSVSRGAVTTVPSSSTGMPTCRGARAGSGGWIPRSTESAARSAMPTAPAHAATAVRRAATHGAAVATAATAAATSGTQGSTGTKDPATAPHHMHAATVAASGSGARAAFVRSSVTPGW